MKIPLKDLKTVTKLIRNIKMLNLFKHPSYKHLVLVPVIALGISTMTTAQAETQTTSATQTAKPTIAKKTVSITLKSGQATEIKLAMNKGANVKYEWKSTGGLNYDTHGDPVNAPKDFYHGYSKGRNETQQSGTLTAAFDGKHGWFWRNRNKEAVTVTLTVEGQFSEMKRVF